ncbi:MAG: hypothetical protein E6R04_07245 [Spirochaetes bacterium]|nr:MAG: hypothetical protein E6R04_07245 [Spirochaetota bacterium]
MGVAGARRYSTEEKQAAIARIDAAIKASNGKEKVKDIARRDGVGYQNYYQWKRAIGSPTVTGRQAVSGGETKRPRRVFSDAEKVATVQAVDARVAAGDHIRGASTAEGITDQQYRQWKRTFQRQGIKISKAETKKRGPYHKKITPIDLNALAPPPPEPEMDVVVIVGKALNVAKTVANMFQR